MIKIKDVFKVTVLFASILLSTPSRAILIEGTEVGAVDTQWGLTVYEPGYGFSVTNFVEGAVGVGVTLEAEIDGPLSWLNDPGSDLYAQALPTVIDLEFFVLKIDILLDSGGGELFEFTTVMLYENLSSLGWAVIDMDSFRDWDTDLWGVDEFGQPNPISIERINYIGGYSVSEPPTLALFSFWLIIIGTRRLIRRTRG